MYVCTHAKLAYACPHACVDIREQLCRRNFQPSLCGKGVSWFFSMLYTPGFLHHEFPGDSPVFSISLLECCHASGKPLHLFSFKDWFSATMLRLTGLCVICFSFLNHLTNFTKAYYHFFRSNYLSPQKVSCGPDLWLCKTFADPNHKSVLLMIK